MAEASELEVSALNALASAPDGTMTLADLSSHLETRFGPTDEGADDAQSVQSQTFNDTIRVTLDGLVKRGFVRGGTGDGLFAITPAGRGSVGR